MRSRYTDGAINPFLLWGFLIEYNRNQDFLSVNPEILGVKFIK